MANAEATALAALLSGLEPADDGLRGFLDDLTRVQGIDLIRSGLVDPDDAPDLAEEPTVGRGNLYALGDHPITRAFTTWYRSAPIASPAQ